MQDLGEEGMYLTKKIDTGRLHFIWTRSKNVSHLAHEIFHATHLTMQTKGLLLSDDSDEAYAYFIQWMTKKVLE